MEVLSQFRLNPYRIYSVPKKKNKGIAIFSAKPVSLYLDYSVDFSRYLQKDERILSGSVTVNGIGLIVTSCIYEGSYLTAFIDAGHPNKTYYLTYHAQSNFGGSFIQDMVLSVVGKDAEIKENYKFLAFTENVHPPDKRPPLNAIKINDRYLLTDSGFFMGI